MKPGMIARRGALGVRLVRSALYLEDEALCDRMKLREGSSFSLSDEGAAEASFPDVHFFTLPNHLLEILWLEEIPKLTGVATAQPEPGRKGGEWHGLNMLTLLLETVEESFGKPVEAIFQSSAQTPDGSARAGHDICDRDICDQAAKSAPDAIEPAGWRFGAWLNLDDCSHYARLRIRTAQDAQDWSEDAIDLEIGRGEGILWPRGQLHVADSGARATGPTNKLVLLGGRAAPS